MMLEKEYLPSRAHVPDVCPISIEQNKYSSKLNLSFKFWQSISCLQITVTNITINTYLENSKLKISLVEEEIKLKKFVPCSHMSPLKPVKQLHLKSLILSIQVPLNMHGFGMQSSISANYLYNFVKFIYILIIMKGTNKSCFVYTVLNWQKNLFS